MDKAMEVLGIILIILVLAIIILVYIYYLMARKSKKKEKEGEQAGSTSTTKIAKQYTTKSIFKFMQFDKIEDNMIIQDDGKRYLMVIECEGVNYDLMSQVEKTAVEAGFTQFLNTLRFPIQIYTQTRTVNIGDSIENYKRKMENIEKELENKKIEYNKLVAQENYNEKQAEFLRREVIRINHLYEYGRDIVENIQKTSQNRNVLRKHYYIVVPYYSAEIGSDLFTEEEKRNMIFAELYTRTQSLIRALFSCEMKCKILNSDELAELLYIAYNRDESETYSLRTAIRAGYNELYTTAPDVLDKRIKALDKQIEENATKLATESIDRARLEKQKKIKKKEESFEDLVKQMAEVLIKDNEKYIGKDIADGAINKIKDTNAEEGGNKDE